MTSLNWSWEQRLDHFRKELIYPDNRFLHHFEGMLILLPKMRDDPVVGRWMPVFSHYVPHYGLTHGRELWIWLEHPGEYTVSIVRGFGFNYFFHGQYFDGVEMSRMGFTDPDTVVVHLRYHLSMSGIRR